MRSQNGRASITASQLEELESLVNPEGELSGREMFSSTRSGSNRAPHGAAFEYDDHRERHRVENERRFARLVADKVGELSRGLDATKVILVAEPHLLGLLRPFLARTFPAGTALLELAGDLTWQAPARILESLQRRGAVRSSHAT